MTATTMIKAVAVLIVAIAVGLAVHWVYSTFAAGIKAKETVAELNKQIENLNGQIESLTADLSKQQESIKAQHAALTKQCEVQLLKVEATYGELLQNARKQLSIQSSDDSKRVLSTVTALAAQPATSATEQQLRQDILDLGGIYQECRARRLEMGYEAASLATALRSLAAQQQPSLTSNTSGSLVLVEESRLSVVPSADTLALALGEAGSLGSLVPVSGPLFATTSAPAKTMSGDLTKSEEGSFIQAVHPCDAIRNPDLRTHQSRQKDKENLALCRQSRQIDPRLSTQRSPPLAHGVEPPFSQPRGLPYEYPMPNFEVPSEHPPAPLQEVSI